MTKTDLKTAIDADGGVKNQRSRHWDEVFKQYNATHSPRLKRGCGSCYKVAYAWLAS